MCDKFLTTAITYKKMFQIITPLSKMLQAKDIDLIGVIDLVKEKIQHLETCDIEFSTVLNEVEEFKKCSINECEDFKPIPHNRIRRVPRKADEIAVLYFGYLFKQYHNILIF